MDPLFFGFLLLCGLLWLGALILFLLAFRNSKAHHELPLLVKKGSYFFALNFALISLAIAYYLVKLTISFS